MAVALLERAGYPPVDAVEMADCLMTASLRGVDTHGIGRLPEYVRMVRSGKCPAAADIRVVADHGSTALMDGGGGFGFVPAVRAMRMAVEKGQRYGIGAVAVRNSGHYGMAAYYPLQAVRAGLLGIAFTNADPLMSAPGSRGRTIGNNPIAMAVPAGCGPPLVLDMASSVASMAKIRQARAAGRCIPVGWGFDSRGLSTTDPSAVMDGGSLAPLGGHKGFGLALFVEVFAGVLTGGSFGRHARAGLRPGRSRDNTCGHFFIAVRVEPFLPIDEFSRRMEAWIAELKGDPAADAGHIRLPGERAHREESHRRVTGIPISPAEARDLRRLAEELGVSLSPELKETDESMPGTP